MPKNKAFRSPPLPFSGNKKYWAGELYDEAALLPSGATVWDCFGGSGVCARCIKDARPDVRVVYNDFDGYSERETFQVLKHARDLMLRCPFILFGDLSIQFWYDALTERFNPRFQVKFDVSVCLCGGKRRSEIMYSNW